MILIIPIFLFLGKKAAIWVFFSISVEILRLPGHAGTCRGICRALPCVTFEKRVSGKTGNAEEEI
jgi:hypothetical protein